MQNSQGMGIAKVQRHFYSRALELTGAWGYERHKTKATVMIGTNIS